MDLYVNHGFWFCAGIVVAISWFPKEVTAFCLLAIAVKMGALAL